MKRPTKTRSDVDIRGRQRRPSGGWLRPDPRATVEAKFIDGPLAGQTRVVPREDYVQVGPFRYSWCGREGRTPLYCRVPKARIERRIVLSYIARTGKDPRRILAASKREPVRRRVSPVGRGRRRRQGLDA